MLDLCLWGPGFKSRPQGYSDPVQLASKNIKCKGRPYCGAPFHWQHPNQSTSNSIFGIYNMFCTLCVKYRISITRHCTKLTIYLLPWLEDSPSAYWTFLMTTSLSCESWQAANGSCFCIIQHALRFFAFFPLAFYFSWVSDPVRSPVFTASVHLALFPLHIH